MRTLSCLSFLLMLAASTSAQTFELVEPSGLVSATVEMERGQLFVHERSGQRFHYDRESRYDSADGRFIGYFNIEENDVLRFPTSGTGVMQTADLDEAAPQFQNTTRIVRRAAPADWLRTQPLWEGTVLGRVPLTEVSIPYSPRGPYNWRPYNWGPYQWRPHPWRPPLQSLLIDSELVPNPPLPPARVSFYNGGLREVQVGVVDLKNSQGTRTMRIRPGETTAVDLTRDSGVKRVAHYRVIGPYGESAGRRFVTEVPPTVRYEIIVHEWTMQSIAIDRTGTSPEPIEDINFRGRGLGRFPLPPGPQLQAGTIDVYRAARSRGNEGTIVPIVAEDPRADAISPLERAFLEQQAAQNN